MDEGQSLNHAIRRDGRGTSDSVCERDDFGSGLRRAESGGSRVDPDAGAPEAADPAFGEPDLADVLRNRSDGVRRLRRDLHKPWTETMSKRR